MKKRLLPIIIMLGLLCSLPVAAWADTYTEGTLFYTVEDGSVTITGCFGKDAVVYVPNQIAGYPVNTIAAGAFTENVFIETVYLPDTVTTVESGAFGEGIDVVFNYNLDRSPGETPAPAPSATPAPEPTATPVPGSSVTATPSPAPAISSTAVPVTTAAPGTSSGQTTVNSVTVQPSPADSNGEKENAADYQQSSAGPDMTPIEVNASDEIDLEAALEDQSSAAWIWIPAAVAVIAIATGVRVYLRRKKQ